MYWSKPLEDIKNEFKTVGESVHQHMYESAQKREFPINAWRALAAKGFMGALVDKGTIRGTEWCAAALHGFTLGSQDAAFNISVVCHAVMGVRLINEQGSARLKEKYLKSVCSGEKIIAFSVTEGGAGGTDAYNPKTRLKTSAEGNFLNGSKWHITNAPHANVFVVLAKDINSGDLLAVVVDRESKGLEVGDTCRPGGARTSPVAPFKMNNVAVPTENIVRIRRPEHYLSKVLIGERILCAFPCISLIEVCIEKALSFSRSRVFSDGSLLSDKPCIQGQVAEIKILQELLACYAFHALQQYVNNENILMESSITKLTGVRYLQKAVMQTIEICASYGLQDEAQLCQALLDATSATAGGGTSYAHKSIIYNQLKKKYRKNLPLLITEETPWKKPDIKPMEIEKLRPCLAS